MPVSEAIKAQVIDQLAKTLPEGSTVNYQYIPANGRTSCYAVLIIEDGQLVNASRDIAIATGLKEHRTLPAVYLRPYTSGPEAITSALGKALHNNSQALKTHSIMYSVSVAEVQS